MKEGQEADFSRIVDETKERRKFGMMDCRMGNTLITLTNPCYTRSNLFSLFLSLVLVIRYQPKEDTPI